MDIDISISTETFSEREGRAALAAMRGFASQQLGGNRLILGAHYRISARRFLGFIQRYQVEVSLRTVYPELLVVSRSSSTLHRAADKAGRKAMSRLLRVARNDAALARNGGCVTSGGNGA